MVTFSLFYPAIFCSNRKMQVLWIMKFDGIKELNILNVQFAASRDGCKFYHLQDTRTKVRYLQPINLIYEIFSKIHEK